MAQMVSCNVYKMGGAYITPERWGFSPTKVRFRPIRGVENTPDGVRLYSYIDEYPNGLSNSFHSYGVVETVATLVTAAG